jgi:AraC-like DNA-binding protein
VLVLPHLIPSSVHERNTPVGNGAALPANDERSTSPGGNCGRAPLQRTTTLTVDHLHEGDRFAYWREEWCQGTVGVTGEIESGDALDFHARATSWTTEYLVRLRCQTSPFRVSRGLAEISRRGWEDWIWLYVELSDGAVFEHAGNEFATKHGDILLTDPTLPLSVQPRSVHDYHRWFLPRAWIEPHLSFDRRPISIHLADSEGLNRLLRSYLYALNDAMDRLDALELPAVVDNFCRLLAVACGGSPAPHQHAVHAAKLRQVLDYISLHLTDPELTPAKAAAAVKISVRQLHLLFEPIGTSFAQHVQFRRLEECRVALANPSNRSRSVTDIAYAWGFNGLASFYRAFRRQFGIAPGEAREGLILEHEHLRQSPLARSAKASCAHREDGTRETAIR